MTSSVVSLLCLATYGKSGPTSELYNTGICMIVLSEISLACSPFNCFKSNISINCLKLSLYYQNLS